MDNYQHRILYINTPSKKSLWKEKANDNPPCFSCKEAKSNMSWNFDFASDKNELIIAQSEDIFSTIYHFNIKHTAIKSVSSKVDNVWIEAAQKNDNFTVVLDFDNKASEIKISFKYEIAPDYIFKIQYKDADKELYYKRKERKEKREKENQEAERKKALDKTVNIEAHTGNMLVNISFNPCSSDCERTVIELYRTNRLMAKYEVEKSVFFKAITDLVYGDYSFVLKQYNEKGNLIYESQIKRFCIEEPISYFGVPGDKR